MRMIMDMTTNVATPKKSEQAEPTVEASPVEVSEAESRGKPFDPDASRSPDTVQESSVANAESQTQAETLKEATTQLEDDWETVRKEVRKGKSGYQRRRRGYRRKRRGNGTA